MTTAPRFRLLAVLILLPVLVLAVLAGMGLRERRMAVRAEAQGLCDARPFAQEWVKALEAAAEKSPQVVLYDDPPVPRANPLPLPEKAIAQKDAAALHQIMHTRAETWTSASGLPGRVIAGWQWMQLRLADEKLDRVPMEELEFLVQLATEDDPSAISRTIIERLAEGFPEPGVKWRLEWWRSEVRRAALRMAAPHYAPDQSAPPQVIVLPLTDPVLTGRDAAGWRQHLFNGAPMIDLEPWPETVAMVFPRSPGRTRVVLEDELHDAFHDMQQKTRYSLPAWAAVNVRMKPGSFVNFALPLRLASLGEDIADVLSVEDMGFCVIETGPRERGWLLRDYYRLLWWAVALIGTALLTSIAGLWLVRRTLERERKLGEMKSQFVSSVSHELRAPVGSMRLMAEALASGKVSGPPADEFHRLMASEGARLSGLIENVLDFARIEQGRKHYTFAETDVSALVQDAAKVMSPQAEERAQKILTTIHPLPFVPQVDAPALQKALINLLENALKFSPANAEVMVTLSHDPSRNTWSLSVTDHGPGIPKAEHTRIFERFYRPGNELRRETTGTGIGLAIVKHVVEGHDGHIAVTSEPGKGSVFIMDFPAPVPDPDNYPALHAPAHH
jgi:signal transduction histidine kinase